MTLDLVSGRYPAGVEMNTFRIFLFIVLGASCSGSVHGAELSSSDGVRTPAMGVDGLAPEMQRILTSYYEQGYGGKRNWSHIESFRAEGVLQLPEGSLRFMAYKKKPDSCKIVLYRGQHLPLVTLSYDGETAWQILPSQPEVPVEMPAAEALDFIRDASIGNHVLHATLPGKTIEFIGLRDVDGVACRDIKVTLPNGQVVVYSIGLADCSLRRQLVVNSATGQEEEMIFANLKVISGVNVAFESRMYVEGELQQTVIFHSAEFNVGTMPWMFSMPEGGDVVERPERAGSQSILDQTSPLLNFGSEAAPEGEGWGFQLDPTPAP